MNLPNQAQSTSQAPSFTIGDIYYVLFRHKWKIILCSLTGILAAAAYYRYFPPPFQSEARLLIKYVIESQSVA